MKGNWTCKNERHMPYAKLSNCNNRHARKRMLFESDWHKKDWYFTGGITQFDSTQRNKLKLDAVGLFSTTTADDAREISQLIAELPELSINALGGRRPVITDGCACCGGNTISFACCNSFSKVNAVEVDEKRCEYMLKHNVNVAINVYPSSTHTTIIHGCYLEKMKTLKQDVVFLDPPWGGLDYTTHQNLNLFLDNRDLADIVFELYKHASENGTKIVVIKAPQNFAIDNMRRKLGNLSEQFENQTEQNHVKLLKKLKKCSVYYVKFPVV